MANSGEGVRTGSPRGIHFLSINASIKSQFEFIQQVWANNRILTASQTIPIH
jgi:hypothetical protein